MWWGRRRKARAIGRSREGDGGREKKREREKWEGLPGGRVLNPASLRCLLRGGQSAEDCRRNFDDLAGDEDAPLRSEALVHLDCSIRGPCSACTGL